MPGTDPTAFRLPERLAMKADAELIADDDRRFAEIRAALRSQREQLEQRRDRLRLAPGRSGEAALDRDEELRRLAERIRTLERFGDDACLGRMVIEGDPEPVYLGRLALTADDGRRLLVDWRAPAAEPYFAATRLEPMGLQSRRRYRWSGGAVVDYWDEAFTPAALAHPGALDDDSAFIRSLGDHRSTRMRDVLGTIQADQDAIIRAGARGALVVDGGPGTGKTVVALHRAAFLRYADSRIGRGDGVLFVGPNPAYLDFVADVLPGLGEHGVELCTLRGLVAEGATAPPEPTARIAALKATGDLVAAIEALVAEAERVPAESTALDTPWGEVRLGRAAWAEAIAAPDRATPHNEARAMVLETLIEIAMDGFDPDAVPEAALRRAFERDEALAEAIEQAWPLLDPDRLVAELWSRPALLRRVAPQLADDDVLALQRDDPSAWTQADLPLLDAARHRIGDPAHERRRRRRDEAMAEEREQRARVADELIAADDSELLLMRMLRSDDARASLADEAALPTADVDRFAGPFAHVIVDEAQELTDAEWAMLLRRCPSRSFTVVGDRAQARAGFVESWPQRLRRIGLPDATVATLSVNYRTPQEVMTEAEPVIRAALPDASVPVSVRRSGFSVRHGRVDELDTVVDAWIVEHADGIVGIIRADADAPSARARNDRVVVLAPEAAKGLEFDLVVLVDPASLGSGITGAVDRYVAMTRATRQLVVLDGPGLDTLGA